MSLVELPFNNLDLAETVKESLILHSSFNIDSGFSVLVESDQGRV